jgi:hypothetical protein
VLPVDEDWSLRLCATVYASDEVYCTVVHTGTVFVHNSITFPTDLDLLQAVGVVVFMFRLQTDAAESEPCTVFTFQAIAVKVR